MDSAAVRRFTWLHTWTGLISGWALFIAFFAGSILVFYHELQDWADPTARRAPAQSLDEVGRLIERIAHDHPEAMHEFQIALPEHGNAVAYWRKTVDGAETPEYEMRELVDGHLVPHAKRPDVLPDFIYQLHYSLGLPETAGMYLLGLLCIIYGLALVSGVVIHAPQFFKDLFALRIGPNLKRLWRDAHNVIGVLSLPFHIMYAYTGAMFCLLALFAASVNHLALRERATEHIKQLTAVAPIPLASGVAAEMLEPIALFAAAKQAAPELHPYFLIYRNYGDQNASVDIYGEVKGGIVQHARLLLNANTGEVQGIATPDAAPLGLSSMNALMGLHFGAFGGPLIQWVYFILGLAGAFLFYSGNLLWIESRRRRRSAEQPSLHRVMAQLTVGICIGCCLGIAALFVANKLPPLPLVMPDSADKWVYYVVFIGSIAYSLWVPPARAAIHLLIAAAITTASIPIVNAATTGDHLLRSARDDVWSVFYVDLAALAMATLFALLARAAHRRAFNGELNSVWALEPATKLHARPLSGANKISN